MVERVVVEELWWTCHTVVVAEIKKQDVPKGTRGKQKEQETPFCIAFYQIFRRGVSKLPILVSF
jgi:hypothetical protein